MTKTLLLLAQGFEMYEASVFIDVLGWNFIDGDKSTELAACGVRNEVTSAFGVVVKPAFVVDEIDVDDYDALAIPGGFEEYGFYKDAYDENVLGLIRLFHAKKKIIVSICVGALAIGKSGILAGKKGTTYKGVRQEQLKAQGVILTEGPIVRDGNIITSWNPSTATDVALMLLETLTTKQNAESIRNRMGFSKGR
jgi:4-methyl-5(b-hydroxyethyl)-thiazole monophosphate biosynthesis